MKRIMINFIKVLMITLLPMFFMGCLVESKGANDAHDINIFHQTPAWNLIKAIDNDDSSKIRKILLKDSALANYREPVFGVSPLVRAVGTRRYKAVKTLLDMGANVNLSTGYGSAPVFEAIAYPWGERMGRNSIKMLELLLRYGADPNKRYVVDDRDDGTISPIEDGTTPLMFSMPPGAGYEWVKLLIDYGADINFKTKLGTTASIKALIMEDIKSAHLLIITKNADISEPYFRNKIGTSEVDYSKPFFPIDLLLYMTYDLDSEEYEMKMEIVSKFEKLGFSYDAIKANIPNTILRRIQKMYPEDWQEYVKKY